MADGREWQQRAMGNGLWLWGIAYEMGSNGDLCTRQPLGGERELNKWARSGHGHNSAPLPQWPEPSLAPSLSLAVAVENALPSGTWQKQQRLSSRVELAMSGFLVANHAREERRVQGTEVLVSPRRHLLRAKRRVKFPKGGAHPAHGRRRRSSLL
jgi:hypothetical protein